MGKTVTCKIWREVPQRGISEASLVWIQQIPPCNTTSNLLPQSFLFVFYRSKEELPSTVILHHICQGFQSRSLSWESHFFKSLLLQGVHWKERQFHLGREMGKACNECIIKSVRRGRWTDEWTNRQLLHGASFTEVLTSAWFNDSSRAAGEPFWN